MSDDALFDFELRDNRTCQRLISASEEPIRTLFVDSEFVWQGWHHENLTPERSPDRDIYGLWGLHYDSTPGDPRGPDREISKEAVYRKGDFVCTIRFPRQSIGLFKMLEISSALQKTVHRFRREIEMEIHVGVASKWFDSLDQFENRGLLMPFTAEC